MKIQFKNVGRGKSRWTADIDTSGSAEEIWSAIMSEVKAHGQLMSNEIDVSWNTDFTGKIYAGFHKVGEFAPAEEAA